jgi:hypothetical protein
VQMPESDNESPASPVSDSAWNRRALESLTMYRELSSARSPEEFAPVRLRFQHELTFNGGFVSRFTITSCFWPPANSSFDIQLIALAAQVFFSILYRW